MSDGDFSAKNARARRRKATSVTVDGLCRLSADARLHLHALPGSSGPAPASMPACRRYPCSTRTASPSANNGKPVTIKRQPMARPEPSRSSR